MSKNIIYVAAAAAGLLATYALLTRNPEPPPLQCSDYANQADCEVNGCYWWSDGTCHGTPEPVIQCGDHNNQVDCEANGCYWWSDGTCRDTQEPVLQCSDHNNQADCEANGCYWWSDGTCHGTPEPPGPGMWVAPIGIPYPNFGIDETVDMYIGQQYTFNDGRGTTEYPISSVSGKPYTHYVDNTHPSATDTDNPYGTEGRPRMTLPIGYINAYSYIYVGPGDIVEVHGGPYDYTSFARPIYSNGTVAQPAFIRGSGVDIPVFQNYDFEVNGQYLIIENLKFYNGGLTIKHGWNVPIIVTNHISVRGNELEGPQQAGYRTGCQTYSKGPGEEVHDVVFFNNHIHHYGDYAWMGDPDNPDMDDAMGINVKMYSKYIWIVDNHIHHNGGDSVHVGNNAKRSTSYVYIGRNEMHEDRENAVDVKQAQNVVISQNIMHDYFELGRPDDGGIAVTHQGYPGQDVGPINIWWIFNEMFNATRAAHGSHTSDELYFIGNVIHDVGIAFSPFQFYGGEHHYYIGNTIFNVMDGIHMQDSYPSSSPFSVVIENNIIDSLTQGTSGHQHLWLEDKPEYATLNNNLLYQQGGQAIIRWDQTPYTVVDVQNLFGQCMSCIEADPQFVDKANYNVHLQPTSPAIDNGMSTGAVQQAFDNFQSIFGVDIRVDIEGVPRPQGAGWDIGAYEYF